MYGSAAPTGCDAYRRGHHPHLRVATSALVVERVTCDELTPELLSAAALWARRSMRRSPRVDNRIELVVDPRLLWQAIRDTPRFRQ